MINLKLSSNHTMRSIKRNLITPLCVMWMKNDVLINKTSVPSKITLEKPQWFKSCIIELPLVIKVSSLDFLDTFDRSMKNEVDEIVIFFISDRKGMTFSHYMTQPMSVLCRKLERSFIEEGFGDFDYNWLPNCLEKPNIYRNHPF